MSSTFDSSGQLVWVVEGIGMRFVHVQEWQAAVMLHYLQTSFGASTTINQLLDPVSSEGADETS